MPADTGLGEDHFLAFSLLAVPSDMEEKGSSSVSFRATNLFVGAPPFQPDYLSKALLPYNISLRLGLQHMNTYVTNDTKSI